MTGVAERFVIPDDLARASLEEERSDWLTELPALVARIADDWQLEVGVPFLPGGATAWVAPARDGAGKDFALKVGWPHPEAMHEADGLRTWGGAGAVWLYRADELPQATVLILERCRPGDATEGLASRGARSRDRRPAAASLDEPPARSLLQALLLHTDLHAGNVLAAERERWLAIDPKPYVGDPAYDVTQHIFNGVFVEGADAGALASRMARLPDLDLHRILRWLLARAVEASPYWNGMANLALTLDGWI
jgi:streptomycin 6-kinase